MANCGLRRVPSRAVGSLLDPWWHFTVSCSFAFKNPRKVEAGDLHCGIAAFRAAFEEEEYLAFRWRSGAAGDKGGVGAEGFVNEAFNRPGLAAVEAGPDGHSAAVAAGGVCVAEYQNVPALDGQTRQSAFHSVATIVAASIGEHLADPEILPGLAAVVAPGFAA